MNKTIMIVGIFLGATAVLLGAFGAHGLEKLLDTDAIRTFETGVTYQMYHALFLLILGNTKRLSASQKKLIFFFITIGVFFFSFSIYFLATNDLTGFNFKKIAFITPLGGCCIILGWVFFGIRMFKQK